MVNYKKIWVEHDVSLRLAIDNLYSIPASIRTISSHDAQRHQRIRQTQRHGDDNGQPQCR